MTTLRNGQAELRAGSSAALVVGDGTSFNWVAEGPSWWGGPEVLSSNQKRSGADGYVAGRYLLGKHVTTIQVNIFASSESDAGDKIDQWKTACASTPDDPVTIRFNALGRTRRRYGYFIEAGDVNAAFARYGDHWLIGSAQFEVLDSRTFGDDVHTAGTGRAIEGPGVVLPVTLPLTLPAGSTGTVALVNAGNAPTPWTARIDGPLNNFTLNHLEFGQRLAFTANGGLTLDTGEWVDLDSDGNSVLFAGTADRRPQLTLDSKWWELGVGTNSIRVAADSGAGFVTFTWGDCFLS